MSAHLNTITLRIVTFTAPIASGTSLADIAMNGCGHLWPVLETEIRSRAATREETERARTIEVSATEGTPLDEPCVICGDKGGDSDGHPFCPLCGKERGA